MDSTNPGNNTERSGTDLAAIYLLHRIADAAVAHKSTGASLHSPFNPINLRWSPGKWFRYSLLEQRKGRIIKSLNDQVQEIKLDDFLDKLLPSMPPGVVLGNVMDELRKEKVLIGDRWSDMPVDPESQTQESVAFRPLGSIFENVVAAAKATCTVARATRTASASKSMRSDTATAAESHLVQNYTFVPNPHEAGSSITRPDGFMIDIDRYMRLTNGTRAVSWYDIAFPGEWTLNDAYARDKDVDDNVEKEVFTLQKIMELDPRRRFALGMTIKNRMSTLWFWSRGAIMASQSFDFISEPEKLARIFISLAFADEVDMGWDPTISVTEVYNEEGKITRVYDIRVGDTVYKTSKILFDIPVVKTFGRATRVFEVTDPQGRRCVLKDAWKKEDSALEYQIQQDMLAAIGKKFDADAVERVRSHIITVTNSWAVEARTGVRDHTTEVMMPGGIPQILGSLYLREKSRTSVRRGWERQSHGMIDDTETQDGEDTAHPVHRRIHVRNVYKELGEPMNEMTWWLPKVFPILRDVIEALYFIHRSGWVHRDISTTNLYLYFDKQVGGQPRGLLGDFEYAKVQSEVESVSTDVSPHRDRRRIGTTTFMSSEVILQGYSAVRLLHLKGSDMDDDFVKYTRMRREELGGLSPTVPTPPFRYNFVHDLESIWWIAILTLYHNDDVDIRSAHNQIYDRRRYIKDQLFPSPLELGWRKTFFQSASLQYENSMRYLPQDFHQIAHLLARMSKLIRRAYFRAEVFLPESLETLTEKTVLHKDMMNGFTVLQEKVEELLPVHPTAVSRKRKDGPSSGDVEPEDGQSDVHVDKKLR